MVKHIQAILRLFDDELIEYVDCFVGFALRVKKQLFWDIPENLIGGI